MKYRITSFLSICARHTRNRHLFLFDALLIAFGALLSFDMRLETVIPLRLLHPLAVYVLLALVVRLSILYGVGIYRRYWGYAAIEDIIDLTAAITVSSVVLSALILGLLLPLGFMTGFPRSVLVIDWLVCLGLIGGSRVALRLCYRVSNNHRQKRDTEAIPIIIAGAGSAGTMIAREIADNPQLGLQIVGFVDDNPTKQGSRMQGLPVLGACQDLGWLILKYHASQVIIAMPSAPGSVIRQIRESVDQVGAKVFTMPGMYEILSGRVGIQMIREVQIEDLLRREPVRIDTQAVRAYLRAKRVAVTGAGGSIGSELCRQIGEANPSLLLLIGHGENSIFEIEQELNRRFPFLSIEAVIADIREAKRLETVFGQWKPHVVFHAAAHKHVPLMENHAIEAITNNILGTRNVVRAAEHTGVDRFIMISTDKAVRPISIMGASKRIAEMIVQETAARTGKTYAAVRFGNVLNSRGSVIPCSRDKIQDGGPVTVTHPEMTRYFMIIPEAVQLVLQAGILSQGGEIFVLDMGEPVKIVDLASDLIRLSGLTPHEDIQIVFTGVRPGEKLHEALFHPDEALQGDGLCKIRMVKNEDSFEVGRLPETLKQLEDLVDGGQEQEMRRFLVEIMAAGSAGAQVGASGLGEARLLERPVAGEAADRERRGPARVASGAVQAQVTR